MADITENPSPLELSLIDYLNQGQTLPFFVNTDWLRELQVFSNSGIIDPASIGGNGPVIMIGDDIFTIESKPDCGPDDTDRYENVFKGKVDSLFPPDRFFKFNLDGCIRGGSAANGAGGPWATGGITSPDVNPYNSSVYTGTEVNPGQQYTAESSNQNSPAALVVNQQANQVIAGNITNTVAFAFQGIF